MKKSNNIRREPLLTLVSIGLAVGLLLTGLAWVSPTFAKSLFNDAAWFWTLVVAGTLLMLTGARLAAVRQDPALSRPVLVLAVIAATSLVYLFPDLFAPGCGALRVPRAFAACPAACRITTCTDWDAPGENGCNAKPPNKGCCRAYETTCDPNCSEPDPDPTPLPVYQPPVISGTVGCAVPGTGGWCKGGAALNLSASDPQGFPTTLNGDIAGVPFSCAGPNCSLSLPVGSGAIHFQASAPASGLSSAAGSAAFAFDPTPPAAVLAISGAAAANGWYTTASVSTTGTDPISGIAATQVAVDGGGWQASATLAEGTHSIVGRASDNAGNVTVTPTQSVKVDATAPTLSASVTAGTLAAGWYVTDVTLTASAVDTTSGLALIEYRMDGGVWTPGDNLVVVSEGVHNLDFRATDQAGLRSTTTLTIQVDQTPPSVSFTPTGTIGMNGWYTGPVSLVVNATDLFSGVASSETRLDNGNWVPGNSLTLGDGEHTVEARATDKAGNLSTVSAAETIGIQVDTIAPVLTTALSGKPGLAGWYVSDVTVSATVADGASGVALTEYRLDGGDWQSGTSLTVSADGPHSVDFRTADRAGNRASVSRAFKIDQTLPLSRFISPLEGSTGALAQGLFTLEGQSTDATSGLAAVQISTDNGLTWLDLPVSSAGDWRTTWDTQPFPNDQYPILARAQDVAGNLQSAAHVTLLLANHPPKVSLQESWWVWETGSLKVQEHFLPLSEIRVRIVCLDGQPDVKLNFTPETLPSALSWDRKCGQGQFATSGNHLVTLTACDSVGNCASATGTIKVPLIAPAIPPLRQGFGQLNPQAQDTAWPPRAVPTATLLPTRSPRQPTPAATQPAVPLTPRPPLETPVKPPAPAGWLWPSVALFSLGLVLGLNSLLDPRPAALRRLRAACQKVAGEAQEAPGSS